MIHNLLAFPHLLSQLLKGMKTQLNPGIISRLPSLCFHHKLHMVIFPLDWKLPEVEGLVLIVTLTLHSWDVVFQSVNHVWLFATPWTAACQASLSFTISWSLLKLMSTESVRPSNYLILFRPLLLLPSIFPIIRVFSNELVLHIRWSKYWSFSFSISPSHEYSGLIFFRIN